MFSHRRRFVLRHCAGLRVCLNAASIKEPECIPRLEVSFSFWNLHTFVSFLQALILQMVLERAIRPLVFFLHL